MIAEREINFYPARETERKKTVLLPRKRRARRETQNREDWLAHGEKSERGGGGKDEGGGGVEGGLWYFASSCSINGALKLINPRQQSAGFVLSSILSGCIPVYTRLVLESRLSEAKRALLQSIPESHARSSLFDLSIAH